MRILLLGGSGCLGTAFAAAAASRDIELVVPTRGDFDLLERDEFEGRIDEACVDAVVNMTAWIDMNGCEADPERAFALHASAPLALAKACASLKLPLLHGSTHAVFDGRKSGVYHEDDVPNPRNVYAASKYAGDAFVANLAPAHYLVRFPMMFGARRNAGAGFVEKLLGWLQGGREVRVARDKFDSPTWARDAAARCLALLLDAEPHGTYHLASAGSCSLFDFAKYVARAVGSDAEVVPALDAEFPCAGLKSLNGALASKRIAPLRAWQEGVDLYLEESRA